jgi:DNA-binding NarL/FixJ family response regulator
MTIRVLIADDHQLIRHALAGLLAATEDLEVVAQCSDGGQVAEAVDRTRPDVVLMDLRMPVADGLEATRELSVVHPEVRVVILTGGLTPATAAEARALGVAGYLLKGDDPGALPDHIRTVAAGGTAWAAAAAAVADSGWPFLVDCSGDSTRTHVEESPERHRGPRGLLPRPTASAGPARPACAPFRRRLTLECATGR